MKSKLLIYSLPVLLVIFLVYGFSTQDDPRNDAAPHFTTDITSTGPGITPPGSDTATPVGFPYPKLWGWVYSGIPGINGGTVGACYFGGKYIENRWNSATLYRINPDGPNGGPGTTADSNNAYNGGAGAIRDMTVAPDGSGRKFLWGGSASTVLYKMDSLGNRVASYTHAGAAYRTIAWDPNRKGFWSSNFSDNIVCRDTNGVVLKTIANTTAGKYGLAWDSTSTADSAYLWVWSQNFTVPTDTTNDLVKINIGTGQIVRTWNFNKGSNIAGGAEIFVKDNKLVLCINFQNYGVSAYNLKDLTPPPPVGNTLVLVHDTTAASTVQRKSDRDTLNRYLGGFIGSYTMKGFDTNTVLPDLSTFNTIILQETSFDAAGLRYLGVGARNQIKTWLASGTPTSKKSLISIGADQSYNYQRTGSGGIDQEFSQTFGKYTYRVDNAMSTAPVIEGVTIDVGNQRAMSTAPPGGSYWPDGASVVAGGSSVLYRYLNHTIADTVAGIGNVQPGYVVATIFQDPRYFTGGFSNVFSALVGWVRANGGLITGTGNNNASLTIPDNYSLSQNYPNPFNPSTKINYTIPKSGLVSLKVYDLLGKEVASLVNEVVNAGSHEVLFNASNLSSGTYFYRIKVGDFISTKKMSLLK